MGNRQNTSDSKSSLIFKALQMALFVPGLLFGAGDASAGTAAATGNEWSTAMGTVQGTRYSSLNQITQDNVGTLTKDFTLETGIPKGHQGQPLVVKVKGSPRMFVVTPYPNRLIALDATSGKVFWTYKPSVREYSQGVACCDVVNRGAAYSSGKVVYTLLDGSVVAVDALTGKQLWKTTVGNLSIGETLTGAPIIVKDKYVIVGNAGAELGVRGWVAALDLGKGKLVWKAFNTGPDADVKINASTNFYAKDKGTNLGVTTWTRPANQPAGSASTTDIWKQGGSTVWGWFTYDPELNLLYYGTANPGVWNPDQRLGDNKWSAAIFARNPDTGVAKWAYQLTPHDGWDYDAMNEVTVIPAPQGVSVPSGKDKVLLHFNKNGFAYMLDAWTGQVLSAPPFVHTTWASGVDLTTGAPSVNPGMDPHENHITTNICPSPLGGKEFTPAAYSDATGLFYIPGINFCTSLEPLKAVYVPSAPYIGAELSFAPDLDTVTSPTAPTTTVGGTSMRSMGEFIAWDPATGTKAWSFGEANPLWGGVLATAGNVVFYGTLDKHFKARDAVTGDLLFDTTLECGIIGNPITYMGSDGKQRVAIYTGVGWLPGAFSGGACPASSGDDDEDDDDHRTSAANRTGRLHVFRLP